MYYAPSAPRTIGTFPEGTVRFGLSIFNQAVEIDTVGGAEGEITKEVI